MGRKRNQAYTEEFRKEAVKRSEQPGVTQAEVARELGLSSQQIANWKRQFTRLSDKKFNRKYWCQVFNVVPSGKSSGSSIISAGP